jgi:hypothetical protein
MSTATTHPPVSQAQRLAAEAAAAAELRTYRTDPDVVALRVEHIRGQVDRLMWAGIVLGLCFTTTNVQQFAAAGAAIGSLAWWSAWLLDPMVSLVLLAVLRAEQVTTRYQVHTGVWPRVAKWALLSATYVMNTWVSWAAGSASGVVLHTVAPLVVVIAAEAVTDLQYALSECVQRAHTTATTRAAHTQPETVVVNTSTRVHPVLAGGVGDRFTGAADERAQVHPVHPATAVAGRTVRRVGEPPSHTKQAGRWAGAAQVARRLPRRGPRGVVAGGGGDSGVGAPGHRVFPWVVAQGRRRAERRATHWPSQHRCPGRT